jgi:N-acyl-D-amino-acid deacylase
MRHPTTMIGSDGVPTLEGKPHPRLYGTFARVLGHYARDLRRPRALRPDAHHRSRHIRRPASAPEGIDAVFVNGVKVVVDDRHTGARPGRVLRRRGS